MIDILDENREPESSDKDGPTNLPTNMRMKKAM